MNRVLLLLLVFATAFQLSGGYALAATLSSPATAMDPAAASGETTISAKKFSLLHYLNQLAGQEKEEKEGYDFDLSLVALCHSFYEFRPIFSLRNKHFLIHYAAAIKGKLPSRYLLLQVFRL